MALVQCTSPQCDLRVYEVTSFNTFEVIPRTRFRDAYTDGYTDGRTDRVTPVYPKTSFVGV